MTVADPVRSWLHDPLLMAAELLSSDTPPVAETGFRNKHRDLPAWVDDLDEEEEEAIFGLLAGGVFG